MSTAPEYPRLQLVKEQPAPLEGVVIEKASRPAWLEAAVDHVKANSGYAPLVGRGYRRLGAHWLDRYHDDYPAMIETARRELREAPAAKQRELKTLVREQRAEYRRHRLLHAGVTGAWTFAGGAGIAAGTLTGGLWVDLAAGLGAYLYGIWQGAGDDPQPPTITTPGPVVPILGGPTGPADDEPELRLALAQLGFPNVTIIDNPPTNPDGTRTITFDLGGTGTVTDLRKKTEGLAAALGRDLTMVDIDKVPGNAGRASLWTASADPFETPRPSPLLAQRGAIDSWRYGVPVAYGKRGNTINLPLLNQNFVIAGKTRSGKGVGASNLAVGTAMDPWVNLRIVAGKENGEWDAYAKAGVAATYFKPNPERLLALLQALLADKKRRERELGKLGKSKLIHDLRPQIGGVELLIIDELATYTRPGKPLRDEILEALIEYSAVAAAAGELCALITQYPEVDVVPQALSMNCGGKWAMLVENATQSNAILGAGQAGAGRDASKFDPPRPGLGWLVNPFAGITDLARSFDLDEDERGEISLLMQRAAEQRSMLGRLSGQWDDPIEKHLLNATGLSSAAGGPKNDGVPGRSVTQLTGEQRLQLDALRGALAAMDQLGRDVATLDEMTEIIGGGMTRDRLSELLRAGGAGGADKVKIDDKWTRGGYQRADIADAERFLSGS